MTFPATYAGKTMLGNVPVSDARGITCTVCATARLRGALARAQRLKRAKQGLEEALVVAGHVGASVQEQVGDATSATTAMPAMYRTDCPISCACAVRMPFTDACTCFTCCPCSASSASISTESTSRTPRYVYVGARAWIFVCSMHACMRASFSVSVLYSLTAPGRSCSADGSAKRTANLCLQVGAIEISTKARALWQTQTKVQHPALARPEAVLGM